MRVNTEGEKVTKYEILSLVGICIAIYFMFAFWVYPKVTCACDGTKGKSICPVRIAGAIFAPITLIILFLNRKCKCRGCENGNACCAKN